MDQPSATPPDPGEAKAGLTELVDATVQFTHQLMKKGVSQATLQVAVRCRPLNEFEKSRGYVSITRLVDDKMVIVLDPEHIKELRETNLDVLKRSKEKQYVFDRALGENATNDMLYNVTVAPLVHGVLRGLNATVFAYGATGSGKTHTMVGDDEDPGLMVLSLRDIFEHISREQDKQALGLPDTFEHISREQEKQFIVECSYMEVYNELLYDLLEDTSAPLELREDPKVGAVVVGLKRILVPSADHIFALLREGNKRRKTESTDANATSSRSHAVLEIICTRSDKNCYAKQVYQGKLALVDLAGAERAHETNNAGRQLRDGANINKSLLALANCINALGKRKKKEFVFVPFRNSKLTRLLKDGLCGNSRTIMVATVSSCNQQYHHTVNTLKYANRAKEIKTHVRRNQGTVDTHIKEYQKMIDGLQEEVKTLRRELTLARTGSLSAEGLLGLERETSDAATLLARQPSFQAPADSAADRIGAEIARLARAREGVAEALYRMDEEIVGFNSELQQWQNRNLLEVNVLGSQERRRTSGAVLAVSLPGESEPGEEPETSGALENDLTAEKFVGEGRKGDRTGESTAGVSGDTKGLEEGSGKGMETQATAVIARLDDSWLGHSGEHAQSFAEVVWNLREQERAESKSDAEATGRNVVTSGDPTSSESAEKSPSGLLFKKDKPQTEDRSEEGTSKQSGSDSVPVGESGSISGGSDKIQNKLKVIEKERRRLRDDLSAVDDALRALDIRIDREVSDVSRARALHLEIELVGARGSRREATRAIEARNAVIDEQAEVISSLWKVLELAGVNKSRALEIARESGLLAQRSTREALGGAASPAVDDKPAVRRRQRSLGGTRAGRRYVFWQDRLKDLPLIRTPFAPDGSTSAVESSPLLPSAQSFDGKPIGLPVSGWDSARSHEPVLMSNQSTPGRLHTKPSRSYSHHIGHQRSPTVEPPRARPHTGESRAASHISRKLAGYNHPPTYVGRHPAAARAHTVLGKGNLRSRIPLKGRGILNLAHIEESRSGSDSERKRRPRENVS